MKEFPEVVLTSPFRDLCMQLPQKYLLFLQSFKDGIQSIG